jgi:hypothetical protein
MRLNSPNKNELSAADRTGVEQFHMAQYAKPIFVATSEA